MFLFPIIFQFLLLLLQTGTIIHEMLHAIGSWHEQSRQDRNNYMTVDMDNIQDGRGANFFIRQTSIDSPFDPASNVMYGIYVSLI